MSLRDLRINHQQRQWARDIEAHSRMQRILETVQSEKLKEIARNRIAEIEAKYPQHFKKATP